MLVAVTASAIIFGSPRTNLNLAPVGDKALPAVTVTVAPAQIRQVDDVLMVTGSVSAWDPLNVGTELSGFRIDSVNVEEGDLVGEGQILAQLQSGLLEAQLGEAKARLRAARAGLGKSIQPNRKEEILIFRASVARTESDIAQQEAEVARARVALSNADLNARRYADLLRMGAASRQEAESAQVTLETARQEVLAAQAKLKSIRFTADQARERLLAAERGGRLEDVEISRASIEEAEAQVAQLSKQISQTFIRAPDDGLIARRDAHIGEISSPGKPLFQIIRRNRLELRAQVNELDLARIAPGQQVEISSAENDADCVAGHVTLINPQVDPASRMGTVRIALAETHRLKPGMFVQGKIHLGSRDAVTVPSGSVATSHGQSVVYLVENDRAISHPVKLGVQADAFVEITNGLRAGEIVVDRGARFLADQDIVRVTP